MGCFGANFNYRTWKRAAWYLDHSDTGLLLLHVNKLSFQSERKGMKWQNEKERNIFLMKASNNKTKWRLLGQLTKATKMLSITTGKNKKVDH